MVATTGFCLLAISQAGATAPAPAIGRIQARDADLAAKARGAVLQLYSLDARLATAQGRLATLRADLQTLRQQREWLLREQRLARLDTRLSQERLASRLRFIYDHGATTSLDILMGSQSLGDALTQLDDVNKVAASNADVLGQVRTSRRRLTTLSHSLASRRRALTAGVAEAAATVAQLERLRGARSAYLDDLARQRSADAAQIATLTAQAHAASVKAQAITRTASSRTQQAAAVPAAMPLAAASAPPAPPQLPGTRTLTVVATGYDLGGRTSTGLPVGWGIAAVDPSVIPLGTRIVIPGYGEAIAADTGGSIVGSTIDLWFPSAAQALAWGRRTVTISVD